MTVAPKINLLAAGLVYFGLFFMAIVVDAHHDVLRFPPPSAGLPRSLAVDMAIGFGAALPICWLTRLGVRKSVHLRELAREFQALLGSLETRETFFLSMFSALGEEFFFRGLVQSWVGLVPAALIFGLLHVGPGKRFIPWTLFATVVGLMLGLLYEWRGDLLAPVAAHFGVNFLNLLFLPRWLGASHETPHGL